MYVLMLRTGRVDEREDQPIAVSADKASLEKYMEEEEARLKACVRQWNAEEAPGSWTRHRKNHGIMYIVPWEATHYFNYHIEEAVDQTVGKRGSETPPAYCPKSADHIHQLDWSTVTPGMQEIIDVDCRCCGRRGSIRVNIAEIVW